MGQFGYRAATETITVTLAQVVTHPDDVLPYGGVARFLVVNTGANNGLAGTGMDSHRVKVNSVPILDCTGIHLRALLEFLRNRMGSDTPAAADLRYEVPVGDQYEQLTGGVSCGIPFGARVSYEMTLNVGFSSAGVSQIGWRLMDPARPPVVMPQYIADTARFPVTAATNNLRWEFKTGQDLVAGVCIPLVGATGITRMRIVQRLASGEEVQLVHLAQAGILQALEAFSPVAVVTDVFWPFDAPLVMAGGSYIEVDVGAGTAGTESYVPLVFKRV